MVNHRITGLLECGPTESSAPEPCFSLFLSKCLSRQIFVEAEEEGFQPTLLDIGGGFVGGRQENMRETASYVNQALDEHFPEVCVLCFILSFFTFNGKS